MCQPSEPQREPLHDNLGAMPVPEQVPGLAPPMASSSAGPVSSGVHTLAFSDYQQLYQDWRRGRVDMDAIMAKFGEEVAELMMTPAHCRPG